MTTRTPSRPFAFDPTSEELHRDPYAVYARLRGRDPIHWRPLPRGSGRWVFLEHADVLSALRHPAFGRRTPDASAPQPAARGVQDFLDFISTWVLFHDDPEHGRLRRVVGKGLSALGAERIRTVVECACDDLLAATPRRGTFDFVERIAFPLPFLVIARLVGVPEAEQDDFRRWSGQLAAGIDTDRGPGVLEVAGRAAIGIGGRLRELLTGRAREPRDDLLSSLAQDAAGDTERETELVGNLAFLLCAGHETTASVLSGGLLALLQDSAAAEGLGHGDELAAPAVEELLRFVSPVQMTSRILQADLELRGRRLRRGQHVDLVLGAANRDPAVFDEPHRLIPTRAPNPHVALGAGPHVCLGAALARRELQIALPRIFARYPRLRLREPEVRWRENAALRGLERLLVEA